MAMIVNSALELIGKTPMLRVNNLATPRGVTLYVKFEKMNPGGSIKDRIAKHMIEYAEKIGALKPGMTVIEASSGNTGIGLAWVCAVKGYHCEIVMPDTMSMERRKTLLMFGTKVILTDGTRGMNGAQDLVDEIVRQSPSKYFTPNQFGNACNIDAYYSATGMEIWDDTNGDVTHFVGGIGTTGTLMGVTRRLKELDPAIETIGVEPYPDDPISGLKNLDVSYIPSIYDPRMIDRMVRVSLKDAEDTARLLALREGLFCGPSSGAILSAALDLARDLDEGTIVAIMPDGGERYLSTELCDDEQCIDCIERYGISCSLAKDVV
ncbi:MAG TPA: cysteine synthase family protein [Methanomicrobia archaeon]|nr:cysteine synthase family protein [Methanomicrobia archaeon]